MKAGLVAALAIAAALAGCSAAETNPHLLAPKLVVHPQDDGNVTLYVHSAFGERLYDRIELSLDNQTVATRTNAFSLETKVAAEGFYAQITVHADAETYQLRARIDLDPEERRLRLAALTPKDVWTDQETYSLPYERIIERVPP